LAEFSAALLAAVEDACLNASAPQQQRWMDGWLLRLSPGKARRARCIHALAPGRLPLDARLQAASAIYAAAGLPPVVRITPFTEPADLDAQLQARGWVREGETLVMVCPVLPLASAPATEPAGLLWSRLSAVDYAAAVGALRGSTAAEIQAHAARLQQSPVPYLGHAFCAEDGSVQACGQLAQEGPLAGVYDVFTRPTARCRGLARLLCERLVTLAACEGATAAYLQVERDNLAARQVYRRLAFVDAYPYHYRQLPAGS